MSFFNPEHQPFAIALIALAVIISILVGDAFFIILAMVFLGVATAQGKHLVIKISIGALLVAVVLYYLFFGYYWTNHGNIHQVCGQLNKIEHRPLGKQSVLSLYLDDPISQKSYRFDRLDDWHRDDVFRPYKAGDVICVKYTKSPVLTRTYPHILTDIQPK